MSALATASYAVGAVGLLVGVAIGVALLQSDRDGAFAYLLVIPGFAALAYVLMALDIGTLQVGGYAVPLPRYVDWLVTTPVLVGYVGYVAGASRQWILGAVAVDALMIAFGLGASLVTGPTKWALFALSAGCHLALLGALYRVFPTAAADRSFERRQLFGVLRHHVGLLWLAYPVVWLAGPVGLGYVSSLGIVLVITYLDVIAKTPYLYLVWTHRSAFDSTDAPSGGAADGTTGAVAD